MENIFVLGSEHGEQSPQGPGGTLLLHVLIVAIEVSKPHLIRVRLEIFLKIVHDC